MVFAKHAWLFVPVALAFGCATSQQAQNPAEGTGSSAAAPAAAAQEARAAVTLVPFQGEGGFTVLMPPKPDQSERTESTPGGPVFVHVASVRDENAKYLASVSDFPQGSLDKYKTKNLLDSFQRSTLQSMSGTLVSSRDVQVGALPGREFIATDPQGSEVTARIFIGNSRVYTLAGTYPQGTAPESIQRFLDSFQPPAAVANGVSGTGPASARSTSSSTASGAGR